jgi:Kdo2-lipid IVA lauroyltransferase/acyltransferase
MLGKLRRLAYSVARRCKAAFDSVAAWLIAGLIRGLRRTDPDRLADFGGRLMRNVGPWLPEHRVGRSNLIAAFPEKSSAEIEDILLGVWDNLGRVAAEFIHLDRTWFENIELLDQGRIEYSQASLDIFSRLRATEMPALVFSAHLANWELPALVGPALGMRGAMLYRRPNIAAIADAVQKIRGASTVTLIPTDFDAGFKIAAALERGIHVGMLVDQYYVKGVDVTFFGRRTKANPLIARLARHFDCPIHGVRMIRLPGRRFRGELTEALAVPRDADGQVNVQETMQAITAVIERWVREHPEQWLWLHRRWR